MTEECWRTISEFPNYEVSDRGNIFNLRTKQFMRTSISTKFGHRKITLTDYDGNRYTRSVALLVGVHFVKVPNYMCDYLMALDGNVANLDASNLAWRPRGFAWKYIHQLKMPQPMYYHNLPVCNVNTGAVYTSVIEASVAEGLLFEDVWESTYTRKRVFPYGHVFEIVEIDQRV